MLLSNFDLLLSDPLSYVTLLVAVGVSLLAGITVHEWAHAASAAAQGDRTAQRLGRLTLNPKAHLDPTGTVMLLIAGFGWGKPVPYNPRALRTGRAGVALVSAAGPLSNVCLALAFAAVLRSGVLSPHDVSRDALRALDAQAWAALVATYSVTLNLVLAVFNLLPLAPLDGSGVLAGLAPRRWLPVVQRLEIIGPVVLIAIIGGGIAFRWSPLGFLFDPVIRFADTLIGR